MHFANLGVEGCVVAMDRDEFFAKLDSLTEKEIEERLPLFDTDELALVQDYVDQKAVEKIRAALQAGFETTHTTRATMAALKAAQSANTKAFAALMLSIGAMLAAIMCGVLIVLRFR
jgi:hypothetical protein